MTWPIRVRNLICKGGMGEVYRGYGTQFKRDGARKYLAGNLLNDSAARRRFLRGRICEVGSDRYCVSAVGP